MRSCRRLTDKGVKTLALHCRQLEFLDLAGCTGITGKAIATVAEQCKQLQVCTSRYCCALTLHSHQYERLTIPSVSCLYMHLHHPQTFRYIFRLATILPHSHTFVITCFLQPLSRLHNCCFKACVRVSLRIWLQHLNINSCTSALEGQAPSLGSLVCLQALHMRGCTKLTDETLVIAHELPVADAGYMQRPIVSGCTKLRVLDVAYCPLLTDHALGLIALLSDLRELR